MRNWFLALLGVLVFACTAIASDGTALTMEQCIAMALEAHPLLISSMSKEQKAASRILQQKAGLLPQANLSGSSQAKQNSSNSSGASARLNQLVTDGGRISKAVEIANMEYSATGYDTKKVLSDVIVTVQANFYTMFLAIRDEEVAASTVRVQQQQLAQARAFFEAGRVPKSDVTAAEVDLSNATLDLTRARGAIDLTRAELIKSMGKSPQSRSFTLSVTDSSDIIKPIPQEEIALETANGRRADLAASRLRLEEAGLQIPYAARKMSTSVSLWGGYDYSTSAADPSQFSAGVTMSVPLYDGGLTDATVSEARANLTGMTADYQNLMNTVALEVVQALVSVRTSFENISTSQVLVRQAQENFDLAQGRYREGVGSSLEVSRASLELDSAKRNLNQAFFSYLTSWIKLEYSMGITGGTE